MFNINNRETGPSIHSRSFFSFWLTIPLNVGLNKKLYSYACMGVAIKTFSL